MMEAESTKIEFVECSCPIEDWVHGWDDDSLLGDYYYCGHCGELTQVG